LTLKGYRQDRTALKKEHYHQAELNYGPFERSIVLPNISAEDVEPAANYANGFLEIHIPKAQVNQPKEIVVQAKKELEIGAPENLERKELDDGVER
jgi:HSP20 family molecular chaperone IbpA